MHRFPVYIPKSVGASKIVSSLPLKSDLDPKKSREKCAGSKNSMPYWTATSQIPSSTYNSEPSMSSSYAGEFNFLGRHSYSPMSSEGLTASQYNLPTFSNSISISGSRGDQHQQSLQHQQHQHQHQQQDMNHAQQPHPQAPPQGPLHASDNYVGRSPVSPIHYPPASTLQQNGFQIFPPSQHSAQSGLMNPNRILPVSRHGHQDPPMAAPVAYHRPYNGYTLPSMTGNHLSHIQAADIQMPMMGEMRIGPYSQNFSGSVYGPHLGQQQIQNDRPFKCDQCPQSFNRNHDLKRHKRIHLAVKPFPCLNCDKSFSRKDALKVRYFS